jgi:hypothetical protein
MSILFLFSGNQREDSISRTLQGGLLAAFFMTASEKIARKFKKQSRDTVLGGEK